MLRITALALVGLAVSLAGVGARDSVVPGTVVERPGYGEGLEGWEEEAFSGTAGKVLGEVVEWLTGERDERVAGSGGGGFRPEVLEVVMDDGVLRVERWAGEGDLDGDLRPVLGEIDGAHGKVKVVEVVKREGGGWRTDAVVQLGGGGLQVNTRWEASWGAGGGLEGIEVTAYEEVRRQTEQGFVERGADVLGGTEAYRNDLALGTGYWLERIEQRNGITVGGWHGLALGDVNGDGADDLYVCNLGGLPNRLFVRRAQDGVVTERGADAGVDWLESTQGALFCDFDNDGDQDLVVSTLSGLVFHSNDGKGNFAVRSAQVFPGAIPYSLAAADYDLDGDLDLFAACYSARTLVGVQRELFERPLPYHDARNGGRNVLLRNDGGWKWSHVTKAAGLDDEDRRYSYACSWEDYDLDGDPDLYVANDFGRNVLYRNEYAGPGKPVRFTEVAAEAGVEDYAAGMSAAWGDYDNDGLADLYVGNMFSSAGNRIARTAGFLAGEDAGTRGLYLRHARGNSVFKNLGGGKFADVSVESGASLGRWAWGSGFADLNNDGWKDVVVANGFISQEDTGDL